MDAETGNPLLHQLMDPLHKELPGLLLLLLLETLHHYSPDVFIQLKSMALQRFLESGKHIEVTQ
jgi:hypothetical protein